MSSYKPNGAFNSRALETEISLVEAKEKRNIERKEDLRRSSFVGFGEVKAKTGTFRGCISTFSKPWSEPSFVVSCLSSFRKVLSSDMMHREVAAFIESVLKVLEIGMRSDTANAGTNLNWYCTGIRNAVNQIKSTMNTNSEHQAHASVTRNEYMKLVEEFAKVEDFLEVTVKNYRSELHDKVLLERSLQQLTFEIDSRAEEQQQLVFDVEDSTREMNKSSKEIIQQVMDRKKLSIELQTANTKLEKAKSHNLRKNGFVEKEKFQQLCLRIEAQKTKLTESEKTFHDKQNSYIKLLRELKVTEEATEITRSKHQELLQQESDMQRCLTPRPDWSDAAVHCSAILKEPKCELKVSSTREAAAAMAAYIESTNLDGHKLLQAHNQVRDLQSELRATRNKMVYAESLLSKESRIKLHLKPTTTSSSFKGRGRRNSMLTHPCAIVKIGGSPLGLEYTTNKKNETVVQAIGKTPKTPAYLRAEGTMSLRLIPHQELQQLISEVWIAKQLKEENQTQIVLEDFFYQFLQNRYGLQGVIAKWGYNVIYSLETYKQNADFELFYLTLIKAIPEGTYFDQQRMLTSLNVLLYKASALEGGSIMGELNKSSVVNCLKNFFPGKSQQNFDSLLSTMDTEQPLSVVFIDLLLDETEECTNNETFVHRLKQQHLSEIKFLFNELLEGLLVCASSYQSNSRCSLEDLLSQWFTLDQLISTDGSCELLKMAFPDKIISMADTKHVHKRKTFPRACKLNDAFFSISDCMKSLQLGLYKPVLNYDTNAKPETSHDLHEQAFLLKQTLVPTIRQNSL